MGNGEMNGTGFTVKETLLQILGRLDSIDTKLDHKAGVAEVEGLKGRMTVLETQGSGPFKILLADKEVMDHRLRETEKSIGTMQEDIKSYKRITTGIGWVIKAISGAVIVAVVGGVTWIVLAQTFHISISAGHP